jgi:pSer/pThr/pTyr-binding forkhead associated (FHA) protein
MLIGRAGGGVGADIEVEHDTVSRRHAEFVATQEGWEVRDLGSVNGTRVDGVVVGRGEGVGVGEGQIVCVGGGELRVVRR